MDTKWLHTDDFSAVIDIHDKFRDSGKFNDWFAKFSKHASDLADHFLSSFASVRDTLPSREELITAFQSVAQTDFEKNYSKFGSRAFHPWFNWYHGYWDNGTSRTENFHIWDNTVALAGRYIQPVTQSTTSFVYNKDESGRRVSLLKDMKKKRKTDLGVDFISPDSGITGWVTKHQSSQELPHVGYLIGEKILIWMAQYVGEEASSQWFMFFERGNRTFRASLYSVDGVMVKVDDTSGVSAGNASGSGKVRYYCQKPYKPEYICTSVCD
ncbi:MAG TPA: hypothetical protein VFQ92_00120 [Blastocatellia bacterium]|nr:hypothetical protein [Blastocatellia bacterium]